MRTITALSAALALLGLSTAANAAELDELIEIWTVTETGTGGTDANDEAHAIAIDSDGNYLVVGWRDGDLDHGDDAYLVKYDNTGSVVWDLVTDDGAVDGVNKFSSEDRYFDVAIDGTDNVCIAGALSGAAYDRGYLVASYDLDGTWLWDNVFQDSGASPEQDAFGIDVAGDATVYSTGWSHRADFIAGQWVTRKYLPVTGALDLGPLYWNQGTEDFAPDQAMDIALASDGFVVVGTVGVDGGTNADDSNRDLHIRKYGFAGGLLWEYTWPGGPFDDVATAVAVNDDDEVVVVGYTNVGTDNGAGADYDWVMLKLDALGYGPMGVLLWDTTWESYAGESERALDVAISDDDDIVVVGDWRDAGVGAWRAMRIATYDGAMISEWNAPAGAGDSAATGVAIDDDIVAMSGYVHNGTDRDFTTTILDVDTDLDGTGDSVDGCPDDELKIESGVCGCGDPDDDTDGDTVEDCDDLCPDDPLKTDDVGVCGCDEPDDDRDGDGTEDCIDNCPDDPEKKALGLCGCGLPDTDLDLDGIVGCDDACSNTPEGTEVDDHGCPLSEEDTDAATDTDTEADKGGCGCDAAPGPTGALAIAVALLAVMRRRKRVGR